MTYKHTIQGPEEFLIKLGVEKNEEFKKNFNEMYDKYVKKCDEQGLSELVFKTENKKVLIYGIRKVE